VAGTANKGGGGGASGWGAVNDEVNRPGLNGGSGIVIIRHPDTYSQATVTGAPTVTTAGGYVVYQFTGSGTISWS
jgi:hypothetical protein